jgi:hypothetical protein
MRSSWRAGTSAAAAALSRLLWSHSIRLEASSKCQLKCPACPTAKGINRDSVVGWGNLTLETFERFVGANPRICPHRDLELGGELSQPRVERDPEIRARVGDRAHVDNGVNFNSVREEALDALVKYRVRSLTVASARRSERPRATERIARVVDFDPRLIANIQRAQRVQATIRIAISPTDLAIRHLRTQ